MEIDEKTKERLKQRKLDELKQKYFNVKMDYVALKAVGNDEQATKMEEVMKGIEQAYKAVEEI